VPIERWPHRRGRGDSYVFSGRLLFAVVVVLLLVLLTVGVDMYTDWLWFGSLGLTSVYATILSDQVLLFFAAALFFLALYLPSAFLARRLAHGFEQLSPPDEDVLWAYIARVGARMGPQSAYSQIVHAGILILGLLLAIIMGSVASGQWLVLARFWEQVPFGTTDPILGKDVAFFVFTLPFLRAAHSWLLGTFVLVATTTFAVYAVVSAYELGVNLERVIFNLPRSVKLHVATIVALLMVLVAANHLLDVYELVYSTRGVTYGASYTDVRAEMPALYIMSLVAMISAVLILVSAFVGSIRPAITGLAAWALVAVIGGLLFPNMIESFEVKPNQLEKERPYVENGIALTRRAFGLDAIQESFYPADDAVTGDDIRNNADTISNIRLWDHRPLLDTLNQIQSIRSYYTFVDVDVDRYQLSDGYRQVMVAVRELNRGGLPAQAQTWVNQRLKFTHGYGVAMAMVAAVAEEGRPRLIVQDVPPKGEIQITRPEVYFGTRPSDYAIIRTTEAEFDYPKGDENAETRHTGGAGVKIGSLLSRLAFAIRLRDTNLLISSAIREDSELLWRRTVRERVQRIAPFLLQDSDPYIVVADGQLYWMLDTYTYTSSYPYSQPTFWQPTVSGQAGAPRLPGTWLNYVRNSVKVTINAYDGSIHFYVSDPNDPIIQTYGRVFDGLFEPMSSMPASLRQHVRYPEDLFKLQADKFLSFHMQDPTVFYNREDSWSVATEKVGSNSQPVDVDPYYVVMKLPNETDEEFLLMQPFTPVNKTNMIAWLAARSDGANYGKLVVYKYPKERLVFGPQQLEGRIDQDPTISSQFTLWSTAGSRVIRGNMLVIPLGSSNLYVEPIYLQAENGPIPELKRVIVSTGNRVVMEPTLEEALSRLFNLTPGAVPSVGSTASSAQAAQTGGQPPAQPAAGAGQAGATGAQAAPPSELTSVIQSANQHYTRAQDALKNGDWATYGSEQKALEADLKRLAELTQ
jgi:uncharacterized membrane protein (UPF0182 family)